MSDAKSSSRSVKLRALFGKILSGKDTITEGNARLFLEAIADQPDHTICIQRLVGSSHGFKALQSSFSSGNTPSFLNGPIAKFLIYLEAPELKTICGGEVLRQVILNFVETPITWNSLVEAARSEKLTDQGIEAFSWLLLQLLSLPKEKAITYVAIIQDNIIQKVLLESCQVSVRLRAQRIVHIAQTLTTESKGEKGPGGERGPGGRHDNDFVEIRKISILPTPDELVSTDPFLPRPSDVENSCKLSGGLAFHIDTQFRLLREDMLRDVREEIKTTFDAKAHRRKSFSLENLGMIGVRCDERQPWSLQLQCLEDLPQLRSRKGHARKEFLKDNLKFLKHGSMTCLLADDEIVTLGTIVRDEDLLVQIPPVLCLQIPNVAVERALLRIKSAKNIKIVQLSTALFAYEPVLRQLQEMKELSLEEEILRWEHGKSLSPPKYEMRDDILNVITGNFNPNMRDSIPDLIANLERDPSFDLKDPLQLPSSTKLDKSQSACFIAGLRQKVTLIQGPPGMQD